MLATALIDIPESSPDLASLEAWLRARPAVLLEQAVFDPSGYCRVTLARTERAELVIVGWLPGQGTEVHGHGDSVGLVRVLTGSLTEQRFQPDEDGGIRVTTQVARPGDVLRETRGRVHCVANASAEPAVSLHFYAPPMDAATARKARITLAA